MADETTETEKKPSGFAKVLLQAVKLDWVRPLIYKVGGRKVALGGGALAVISQVAASEMADWPKAIVCLAAAVAAGVTAFSISHEDAKKGSAPGS